MFTLSAIFTTNVYLAGAIGFFNCMVFGGMGLTLELVKVLMIPITVSAYKKHDKLLAIVSTSFLTVLISISIFANYQYVTNLTTYKNDSKKIVSSEYEKLNQDKKIIESKIESHGSEIKKIDPKIESLEKKLNQKLNQKNEIIESKKALTSTESNI